MSSVVRNNGRNFPSGFFWGASTSSHQVEGGQDNDWSAWERSGKLPGGVVSGSACDHWNRFEEDFDIAHSLNHTAHRFSIEWSRVEPSPGVWNDAAIDHYRHVVAALRTRGIEPFVTLWHFTSPQWFTELGGWESRNARTEFARYAAKMAESLPDVRFWITINEANVYALLSYLTGYWPPEVRNPLRAYRVYRNLAAGHVAARNAIRGARKDVVVGSAHSVIPYEPYRPSSFLDRWSARMADTWYNRRWLAWTAASSDFLGVNHYYRQHMKFHTPWQPFVLPPSPQPHTDYGWEMYPHSMYLALQEVGRYGKPVYITENGVADAGDRWRQQYIRDVLREIQRAMQEGADVRGYLHWSLLDNFEWREGFTKRFGLVAVDFATQLRTVRPSAQWYANVCRENALPPES